VSIPSILQKIVAHKRREVAERKAARPAISLANAPPIRSFADSLRRETVGLIAEVKQASPSKGVMAASFEPVELARTYAANGAACFSVLTDEEFFRGHDRYLQEIRAAVELPLLRKEFIIDRWQIAESRALGADAILLIVAILSDSELRAFSDEAADLGMSALIETHSELEFVRALALDPILLGINNRNLHTFETDLETTERLAALTAHHSNRNRILVSESGIGDRSDVERVARSGARAILVGEALVRTGNPTAKIRELASVPIASSG
jgi:indole-3-glycerol phosphate synthase